VIELNDETAVGVAVSVMVVVVAWGALVSSRTAVRGPAWALGHLRAVGPVFPVAAIVGMVVLATVDPVWVGGVIAYLAVMAWWLARAMRRSLAGAEAAGGFEGLPSASRARIVGKARTGLWVVAGLFALLGVAVALPVPVRAGVLVMAAVMVINGVLITRHPATLG
jgi:hypothetical protein